jgi:hypothetical protein
MTSIHPVSASLLRRPDTPLAHRASEPRPFTRKTDDAGAVAAAKDKARISLAALAGELDAMFPIPGKYRFPYAGTSGVVERLLNGQLQIGGPIDRFVRIQNGVIIDEHVLQGDISRYLTAAKNAQ